jgi:CrcB protein
VNRLAVIAAGGVLGSLARFGLSLALVDAGRGGWPMATFLANVVGCLLIGIIASSPLVGRGPHWLRPFAITGVLGGFTTFSAFALETGVLLDSGRVLLALSYAAGTMVTGLLAVRLGVVIAGREGHS